MHYYCQGYFFNAGKSHSCSQYNENFKNIFLILKMRCGFSLFTVDFINTLKQIKFQINTNTRKLQCFLLVCSALPCFPSLGFS